MRAGQTLALGSEFQLVDQEKRVLGWEESDRERVHTDFLSPSVSLALLLPSLLTFSFLASCPSLLRAS